MTVRRGAASAALVVLVATLLLSGCAKVEESSSSSGYEPAHVEEVANADVKRVIFTRVGADQVDLKTVTARRDSGKVVVPYAALIYDGEGETWVYTNPKGLTFLRVKVTVDHVEGGRVVLSDGLRPGTRVVTVGAAEVYGAELEIAGGH